jgi:heat shock protein HslJ
MAATEARPPGTCTPTPRFGRARRRSAELVRAAARLGLVQISSATRTRPAALLALAVAGVFALAACAGVSQLAGKDFVSVAVTDGGAPRPLAPGTSITMAFTPTDVSGNAGCNHYGGTYRIENGLLRADNLGMTAMGCDPERDAQDVWLLRLLGSKPAISLIGTDLTLTSGSIVITLRDREIVEPDSELVGTTWQLDGVIAGDAVSSLPAEPIATLVFRADGTIEVNTGCNRGSGTWSAVAGGIDLGPVLLTKMACQKDPATLESAVLGVLEADSIAAAIEGPRLTLQAGGRGLILRAT